MCNSFTTDDLPTPEYPETRTSSGVPLATDPIERGEQHLNFALPPVEFLGDHKAVRRVVFAERELADSVLGLPRMEASLQIMLDAGRRLIAFLRRFREQLHDDHGHTGRNIFSPLARSHRLSCNMAVHPFHRIASAERQSAGQDFV